MKHSPKKSMDSVSNFIEKTYRILENEDFAGIIGWTPLGSSFVIRDIKQFEELVLPIHFKHSNFSSFVRQLNMYNFHKVRGDRHDCEFEQEQFKKGRRDMLSKIKRKQSQALIVSHNNIEQGGLNCPSLSEQSPEIRKIQEIGQIDVQSQENPQTDTHRLEQLRKINKTLKELKNQKLQKQKTLSSINNTQIGEKFFKLITTLLAQKIRNQFGFKIKIEEKNISKQLETSGSSFDCLIDHIIGDAHPLDFSCYTKTAYSLSEKQNGYDFGIKKESD